MGGTGGFVGLLRRPLCLAPLNGRFSVSFPAFFFFEVVEVEVFRYGADCDL